MRSLVTAATFFVLAGVFQAGAETKIFIIENHRDGYGVDQCLASGATCGKAAASFYCQSRQFSAAGSFRQVDRDEITGDSGSLEASCRKGLCGEYVAIECTR